MGSMAITQAARDSRLVLCSGTTQNMQPRDELETLLLLMLNMTTRQSGEDL